MKRRFILLGYLVCFNFIIFSFLHSQTDFSQENASQLLRHLSVDIGPRPMGSLAEHKALEFAVGKFKEYGCDTAYIMTFDRYSYGNTNSGVAVGIKHGITKRTIVIGGHIDSAEPEIPGADDDGSGSAVVMEAARVSAKRQTQSTLVFCCFGGEESGLVGSLHFTRNYSDIDSVALMLQVDMAEGLGILDFDPDAHKSLSAPRWLVAATVEEFNKLGYKNLRYPTHFFSQNYSLPSGPASDHEPFLQIGIPAIAFVTDVTYPIHTPRDIFENFDPRGLKRSGDLIVKLVDRFDGGTPNRELENYWLLMVWNYPIFIPPWGLWLFLIISVTISIITFISVRKRREPPGSPERIRWSGIKMFLFSLIIVTFGWLSSDVIGLIKDVHHPWLTTQSWYFIFAGIAMLIGSWIVLRLSNKIRLSSCPYVFFKRAVIMLTIALILLGLFGIKLTVEPAVALLFISCSILIRNPILKLFLVVVSPLWMIQLIFSEWSGLFFHGIAGQDTTKPVIWFLVNGGFIFFFSLYILPYLFAFAAVIRDSSALRFLIPKLKSVWMLLITSGAFIGLAGYLIAQPAFNGYWQRDIHINQDYDINKHSMNVDVKSSEYLNGLTFRYDNKDTVIPAFNTAFKISPKEGFDTNMINILRQEKKEQSGDAMFYDIELTLAAKFRPYKVSISYSIDGKDLRAFDTPHQFRTDKDGKHIDWYSFPDSILTIPVKFSVVGNYSVKEKIEVVFDKLAYPIDVKGDMLYVMPRTRFIENYIYKK